MTIRDAVPDDLEEIAALIHELAVYEKAPEEAVFTLDGLAANVFGPNAVAEVLIAEADDGAVAGMALYFRTYSTWLGTSGIWLEDLFVRPQFRGAGHGRRLLDAACHQPDGTSSCGRSPASRSGPSSESSGRDSEGSAIQSSSGAPS